MRILVLGGTGFIGPAVVARLVQAGHEVTVFHRGRTEPDLPAGVRHLHGDRARLLEYAAELRRLLPDVVLDMFAYSEADARAVMAAIRGVARRVVVLSSQDVYRAYGRFRGSEPGPLEPVPVTEESPLRAQLFPYRGSGRGLDDYEKILVERVVLGSPFLPGTVLRLPMVYGERDRQRRLALELRRMDHGRPAFVLEETFSHWRWTRGYVDNVAGAIALATADPRAAGRLYNVGEPDALSYADWVREVGRAAGWTGRVVAVPDGRLPHQLRPPDADYAQHLVADTTRIREELGYVEPVPRLEALRRTIDWERAHHPAPPLDPSRYAVEDALLGALAGAGAPPGPPQTP